MDNKNIFFNFDTYESNLNSRNITNTFSESQANNERFRNYDETSVNPDRHFVNERCDNFSYSSTSFPENSNVSLPHNVHPYPMHLRPPEVNILSGNQSKRFPEQSLSTNPFPKILPANIAQPPFSMDHLPSMQQNMYPPLNPPNPFTQIPVPPNLPFFPPPASCVTPFSYLPPSFDVPPPSMGTKGETNVSIDSWLKNRKAEKSTARLKIYAKKLSISEFKDKLTNLATQIKELDKLTTHLQIMSKSLDYNEWSVRKLEVVYQKKAVEDAMNVLKNIPEREITSLLQKRKNKRIRLKRKREEFKELKKEKKALCQLEHSRIDMWLDKMKEQVERTRREEDIKKQADYVLSEVFHKKAEAKRMLSLLTTLGKLRNARIHDRESKGEFVSKEAAETFNSIIETLKKRWLNQINGYNLEEQGLRVMLSDAEVKRSNVEKSLNKQIYQQWLKIMFGDNHNKNDFPVSTDENLINVRKKWDQFIVGENSQMQGSSIPNGWILPAPPSNEVWSSFLKN